jgi:hypothetical protein
MIRHPIESRPLVAESESGTNQEAICLRIQSCPSAKIHGKLFRRKDNESSHSVVPCGSRRVNTSVEYVPLRERFEFATQLESMCEPCSQFKMR